MRHLRSALRRGLRFRIISPDKKNITGIVRFVKNWWIFFRRPGWNMTNVILIECRGCWHPFRGAVYALGDPVVSLRSTTGYKL